MTDGRELAREHPALLLEVLRRLRERETHAGAWDDAARILAAGGACDGVWIFAVADDARFLRLAGAVGAGFERTEDAPYRATGFALETLREQPGGVEWPCPGSETPAFQRLLGEGYDHAWAGALVADGDCQGVLVVAWRTADAPLPRAFLCEAGALLADALREDSDRRRMRLNVARNELLPEFIGLFNSGAPVAAMFDPFYDLMARALDFDGLDLAVADGAELLLVGSKPVYYREPGERIAFAEARSAGVRVGGSALVEYRTDKLSDPWSVAGTAFGIHRAVFALLRENGDIVGTFAVGRRSKLAFSPDDRRFLELVAGWLQQAITNGRRVARAHAAVARSQLLNELALLLNDGETVDALFDRILALLERAIDFDYVGLLAATNEPGEVRMVGSYPELVHEKGALSTFETSGIELMRDGPWFVQYRPGQPPLRASSALRQAGIGRVAASILRDKDELLGLFSIGRKREARYDAEEEAFIRAVAALLEQAIANQRRLDETRAAAARSELLNELSILLNAGEPVEAFFDRLPRLLHRAIPFDYVGLAVVQAAGGALRALDWNTSAPDTFNVQSITRGEIDFDHLVNRPATVVQFRLRPGVSAFQREFAQSGLQRSAVVVLKHKDEPLGVLHLSRMEDRAFTAEQFAFLEVVATLLAQAVANQLRIERSAIDAEEQRLLADLSAHAARESDPAGLLSAIEPSLRALVPLPFAAFVHLEGEVAVWHVAGEGEMRLALSAADRAAMEQLQLSLPEIPPDFGHEDYVRRFGIHASALTPCLSGGAAVGMLLIGSRKEGFAFGEHHLRLFRLMAQTIGPAVETARANAATASQGALYNLILSSLSEAVVLLDHDMRAVFANEHGSRLMDLIDPKRKLRTLDEHLPALPSSMREAFRGAVRQRVAARGRARVHRDGGEAAWYDYELVPLDDPGLGMVVVAADVTAEVRRQAEQDEHRDQIAQTSRLTALGELIGGVAHELNNPLTAILGFAEVIARSGDAAPFREELGVIQKEALRAGNIVRDLLFIARPAPIERTRVEVAAVVGHIERLRRTAWAQHGITATVALGPGACELWGNEHQLTQVLLNLVSNAEHALEGVAGARLGIAARCADGATLIEVTDNGRGMDAATARRVFEPFFTTRQGQGTGLGLSLSYSMITAHSGRIEVKSKPGRGTRFRITLPACEPPQPGASSPAVAHPARPLNILVIDDEPSLRKVCQRMVGEMGHTCSVSEGRTSALELIAANAFDLVLCDYRLAGETADAVIEAIAATNRELLARTVIATGATSDPGVLKLIGRYQLRLIAKPYGFDEIAALLAAVSLEAAS